MLARARSNVPRVAGGEAKALQPLNRAPGDNASERPDKRPKVRL